MKALHMRLIDAGYNHDECGSLGETRRVTMIPKSTPCHLSWHHGCSPNLQGGLAAARPLALALVVAGRKTGIWRVWILV